jgi:hypothetical protein
LPRPADGVLWEGWSRSSTPITTRPAPVLDLDDPIHGDNPLTAAAIAAEAGVDDYMAEALGTLNIMRLANAHTAILSGVIFNAIIIVLHPAGLARRPLQAMGAQETFRRNIAVFGVGGVKLPKPPVRGSLLVSLDSQGPSARPAVQSTFSTPIDPIRPCRRWCRPAVNFASGFHGTSRKAE